MRVITGIARGRKLQTLPGLEVRPTSEAAKEAIFSILQNEIENAMVLDLFAGSGQLGTLDGGSISIITSSGTQTVGLGSVSNVRNASGTFVITGTGNGHNVGMSQYGAKAMAEQGYDYEDILNFYYTDITIK